jgi:hypothetical protein
MDAKQYQLAIDMKHAFGSEHGKRVLDHLMLYCFGHVNQDCFVKNNSHETANNLGRNMVYRHIRSYVDAELKEITDTSKCQTEPENERT